MRTLVRKAVREIYGLGLRAIAIALITSLGVMVFTGGFMARNSLTATRDYYYRTLKLADLDVYFDATGDSDLPKLNIPGIKYVKRFIYQTSLDMAGKAPISIVLIHQRQLRPLPVNNYRLVQGRPLADGDKEGILIDQAFAKFHHFRIGDKIGLRSLGFPVQLTVRGIVITPEYLIPMGSPYMLVPQKGSLGVAFATMDRVDEIFGYSLYNNMSFLYDASGASEKQAILKALAGLHLTKMTNKQEQFSYKWMEQDVKGFNVFVPAMVFLFGVVVCVVTMMVFNRLVQSQRREIGV